MPRKTPQMHRAQQRVWDAIKRGEIKKPKTCAKCGKSGPLEAAHQNYTGRLSIKWLCRSCHHKSDRRNPKSK